MKSDKLPPPQPRTVPLPHVAHPAQLRALAQGGDVAMYGGTRGRTVKRFNKAAVSEYVEARRTELEAEYGFMDSLGWAQVEGKGEEANRAYGEYDALARMAAHLGVS